jgi:hypothetical protein
MPISEFLQVRMNVLNIKNVERSLLLGQTLYDIREFILVENHIDVMNVGRPLVSNLILLNIREFTVVKNLMNVKSVRKLSLVILHLTQYQTLIKKLILVRNPMNIRNVEKPLFMEQILASKYSCW